MLGRFLYAFNKKKLFRFRTQNQETEEQILILPPWCSITFIKCHS